MKPPTPKEAAQILADLHERGVLTGPAVRITLAENPRPAVTRDEARVTFFDAVDRVRAAESLSYRQAFAKVRDQNRADYALVFGG